MGTWNPIALMTLGSLLLSCASDPPKEAAEKNTVPTEVSCVANTAPPPLREAPAADATLPPLHVEGTSIVDDQGRAVALRGVNFGSWLMMEAWIAGVGALDEGELLEALASKATELGVRALYDDARAENVLDWLGESKSHWRCVQEWKASMFAQAKPGDRQAVVDLWIWFDDQPWVFEEQSLWRYLAKRFGDDRAEELREVFVDRYVTENDVERAAAIGLNLIRVPVWYQALEHEAPDSGAFRPQGWRHLDDVVDWARAHRMYVMIDLHGAPGGQSTSWHQGLTDGGYLWTDEACIAKTERLWRALAAHFAGDPHVAVYDLLNEPIAAPDRAAYASVHDRLYRAVREHDPDTIVMSEDGYLPTSSIALPSDMGWTNAMFSLHLYETAATTDDYLRLMEKALTELPSRFGTPQTPIFLGEFNPADGQDSWEWEVDALDRYLGVLNRRGVHWAPWTWKYADPGSRWGVLLPATGRVRVDLRTAGFEEVREAFAAMSSDRYLEDPGYARVLGERTAEPLSELNLQP